MLELSKLRAMLAVESAEYKRKRALFVKHRQKVEAMRRHVKAAEDILRAYRRKIAYLEKHQKSS